MKIIYEVMTDEVINLGYAGSYLKPVWKKTSVSKYYFFKMCGIQVRKRRSVPESYPGDHLQGLFNLMWNEHELILFNSEMDDIIREVEKIQKKRIH